MPTHIGRCELREYPSGWWGNSTAGKCKEYKGDGGMNLPQDPRQVGQKRGAGQHYWVLFWRVIEHDDISLGLCDLRSRQ